MKKTVLIIVMALSLSASAQTKQDSIAQVEANKWVDSLLKATSINDFKEWIYSSLPAKNNDEFLVFFNSFLRNKYELWLESKKKK